MLCQDHLISPVATATSTAVMITLLTLPNEILRMVVLELVELIESCRRKRNVHRDLCRLAYTCQHLHSVVTPVLYHTVKVESYDDYHSYYEVYETPRKIRLLSRTLESHRSLGEYVRTLCITFIGFADMSHRDIIWNLSSLLLLLPNLENLTIPFQPAAELRHAKLPRLSSLSYGNNDNTVLTEFPLEILFQPSMRCWKYCFPFSSAERDSRVQPLVDYKVPPLPSGCTVRSSPVTHIEFVFGFQISLEVVHEVLTWPRELLSFSFEGMPIAVKTMSFAAISKAIEIHRTSLRKLRLPCLPASTIPPMELLRLETFEHLECITLDWGAAEASSPVDLVKFMPPGLTELTLIHNGRRNSARHTKRMEWLKALAKVMRRTRPAFDTLRLNKDCATTRAKWINFGAMQRMENAWYNRGFDVEWI